jgi:hypothetical protein
MASKIDIVIGTPICRRTSFVLDKFLANQQEIQQTYPGCKLVLATDEPDFIAELKKQINHYHLNGGVITYETVKPDYARSRVWSVTCGREALRHYALSKKIEFLLFLDADMIVAPSIITIMKDNCNGFDVVYSGYIMPPHGFLGFGTGCLLINRKTLNKMTFRCYEFNNGQVIDESEMVDWGLFKCHARVNKGIFVAIKHHMDQERYYTIEPRSVGWFKRLTNNLTIRFVLTQMCILARYNIARKLQKIVYRDVKLSK